MDVRYQMLICAAALFLPSLAVAQGPEEATSAPEAELVTDRPDFTESSSTVPSGRLQLEAGVEYNYFSAFGGIHAFDGPNLLGRIGVADFAEIRLELPNVEHVRLEEDTSNTRFGVASVGAKFATSVTDKIRVGVIPSVAIGVEDASFAGGITGTAAFDVTDAFGLGVNAGISGGEGAGDDLELLGSGSLAAGYSLTDALGIYLEGFALVPEGDVDFFANTGLTYLVAPLVQLDAYVGTDVPDAEVIFGGGGVSVLF